MTASLPVNSLKELQELALAKPGWLNFGTRGAGGQWTMGDLVPESHPVGHLGAFVWAFGEDGDGELYVLTNQTGALGSGSGKIWKLVKAGN